MYCDTVYTVLFYSCLNSHAYNECLHAAAVTTKHLSILTSILPGGGGGGYNLL